MAPDRLVRLNDLLGWINPILGGVAALLAMLVIAAAAERFSTPAPRPAAQAARQPRVVARLERPRLIVPPEWRDLQLYD
jgi:hypothetical protein